MSAACIINPVRGPKDPQLPARGLFCINPPEARRAVDTVLAAGGQRGFLYQSGVAVAGDFFVAGPAIGAPFAAICLEKLIACGARQVVVLGWCGALAPPLDVGDLLVPSWARSEEGTSAHYRVDGSGAHSHPPESDATLRQQLASHLTTRGMMVRVEPLWTTDAPYRETVDKVTRLAAQGIAAVEMEYAALCSVAAFRGIALAGVYLVSDCLYRTPWQPAFGRSFFRNTSKGLVAALLDFCQAPASG